MHCHKAENKLPLQMYGVILYHMTLFKFLIFQNITILSTHSKVSKDNK